MESPSASARGRCHPKTFECKVFHLRILQDGFLGAGPGCPAHLAQLLIRAGDIELYSGPPLRCPICSKGFRRTDSCVWCHHGGWTHTRCTQLASHGDWNEDFLCGKCSHCVEAVKPQEQPKNRRRKKPNAISVLQLNANGIRARRTELSNRVAKSRPNVIAIQETGLDPKLEAVSLSGYNVADRKDRTDRKGGGSLIYVRDDMPYTTIDVTRQNGPADITAVQIHPRATEAITVINVYNPPPRWTEAGDEDNSRVQL